MIPSSLLLGAGFLATGCFNSIITQVIYNYVPINSKSMLLVLCAYIGYALRYFLPTPANEKKKRDEEIGESKKKRKQDKPKGKERRGREREVERDNEKEGSKLIYLFMFLLVFAEAVASQLSMIGFTMVGSGLFQVLYSSIILFTAVVAVVGVGKYVAPMQWLALVFLTAGLIVSAGRVSATIPPEGIAYLFSATFIFSVTSTIAEALMRKYDFPSSRYSMFYGFFGSAIVGSYMLVVTRRHWTEWITGPIASVNGNVWIVAFLLAVLVIGQLIRGIVYYKCISAMGSVSTGVLYALQAVCMFCFSALMFCDEKHPNQCFTSTKAAGTAVVSFGVALYSIGAPKDKVKE